MTSAATIAATLRAHGFPQVNARMVAEIIAAHGKGRRGLNLPHGLIGMLVGKALEDAKR